ncbi:MAG TPA: DNA polymerase III subunit delta' [Gemmataceae bacterium]|nr:DNA polymerase III subunit delta' [Gemmataceae bacterium]
MSWQRVRGHDHLVQAFDQARRRRRLAHAYLFAGPPGIGKRLFATELAKTVLCENPPAGRFEACDQCAGCLQIEAGTHPDFFVYQRPEDKHELPIEMMRALSRDLALKPARGRGRVAIIDDADDLSEEAANCFLKTLEEPPPGSLLILIGTSPELQLSTIVSRCQVVRFAPLSESLITELLRSQPLEDTALIPRVARLSGGSMGKAVALADPSLWDFRHRLLEALTAAKMDRVQLAESWNQFIEEAGKESASQRQRAALVLGLVIDFLNQALLLRIGKAPHEDDVTEKKLLKALSDRLDAESMLQLLERCLEADMQIDRRAQLGLVIEALVDALGQQIMAGR